MKPSKRNRRNRYYQRLVDRNRSEIASLPPERVIARGLLAVEHVLLVAKAATSSPIVRRDRRAVSSILRRKGVFKAYPRLRHYHPMFAFALLKHFDLSDRPTAVDYFLRLIPLYRH